MSNGPFHPGVQFAPTHSAAIYGSLTDLLSDGYDDSQVVIVWPADGDPTPTHRQTIRELRRMYDGWMVNQQKLAAQELIDKVAAEPVTFRQDELTLEWGWRLRHSPDPTKAYKTDTEEEARAVVASSPDLCELVCHYVTKWSTEGTE